MYVMSCMCGDVIRVAKYWRYWNRKEEKKNYSKKATSTEIDKNAQRILIYDNNSIKAMPAICVTNRQPKNVSYIKHHFAPKRYFIKNWITVQKTKNETKRRRRCKILYEKAYCSSIEASTMKTR